MGYLFNIQTLRWCTLKGVRLEKPSEGGSSNYDVAMSMIYIQVLWCYPARRLATWCRCQGVGWGGRSPRCTSILLGRQVTNKTNNTNGDCLRFATREVSKDTGQFSASLYVCRYAKGNLDILRTAYQGKNILVPRLSSSLNDAQRP